MLKYDERVKNRPYKVINLAGGKGNHSHLKSKKEAVDLIHFYINRNIPIHADIDYLTSYKRLLIDKDERKKVEGIIQHKVGEEKLKYINRKMKRGTCL